MKMFKCLCAALLAATLGVLTMAEDAAAPATAAVPDIAAAPVSTAAASDTAAPKLQFSDVPADAPYHDAVYKLVDLGVLAGYPDGTFQPQGHLTRAEMCKMINLTFGYTDATEAAGFPDLDVNEWYMPYVLAAQKAGYVKGDGDTGNFRPNADISRQEVCVILTRIIEPYDLEYPMAITDKVDEWAKPYVDKIVKNYIMPIEEGGTFRATEPIKRFELASALAPFAKAKVETVKLTMTFRNGETVEQETQIDVGATLTDIPQPKSVPTGMKFVGWSYDEKEYAPLTTGKVYTEDTVLYAFFEKQQMAVTFYVDDLIVSKATVKYGEFAKQPIAPTKTGYTFEGWSLSRGGAIVDVDAYPITASTSFYAYFTKPSAGGGGVGGGGGNTPATVTYAVVFIANGAKIKTVNVEKGSTVKSVPAAPELDGYTFLYWSQTENGPQVDPKSVTVKKAINFYGVYEKNKVPEYTVKFVADGKTLSTETVESGKKVTGVPEAPARADYTFMHWSLTADGTEINPALTAIKNNTTFYAVYEKNKEEEPEIKKYTVTFKADGIVVSTKSVEEGKCASAVTAPDKKGYTFRHWSLTSGGAAVDPTATAIRQTTTFYAVYEKDIVYYTVRFYADGEKIGEKSVEEGKTVTAPSAPAKVGYTFKYYSDAEDGSAIDVSSVAVYQNMTYYAVYEKDIVYYSVKFYANGALVADKRTKEGDTPSVPSAPDKAGYTFVYWSAAENGTEADPAATAANKNLTYYAVYKKDAVFYTVTFMADGKQVAEKKVEEGKKVSVPSDPSKTGYTFLYWSEKEGGSEADPASVSVTKNMKYYAVFEEIVIKYTVTFVAQGKTVSTQIVEKGDYAAAPKAPKVDKYEFVGWSKTEDGSVVEVDDVKITADTTFYAVYELSQSNPNDPKVIEALRKAVDQLGKIRLTDEHMKNARKILRNCISDALEQAEMGVLIDSKTVQELYEDEIAELKDIVTNYMTTADITNFVTELQGGLDEDVYDTIVNYFLDENMKNKLMKY